jgi:hypothetical protein
MMNDLPLPPRPAPASADALAKARAAMLGELTKKPAGSWRRGVAALFGTIAGLVVVVAALLVGTGESTLSFVAGRAVTLVALLLVGAVTTWAALKPQGRVQRLASLAAVVAGAVLIVALRGAGLPSESPHWVCTASHFGVGLVPAALVSVLLRNIAPSRLRSLVAGLAAGTTGAAVGELACARSAEHVALFHLPAWVAVAVLVVVVSSRLAPRSYAP